MLERDRPGNHERVTAFAHCVRKRATAKLAGTKPALEPIENGHDRFARITDRGSADDRAARHVSPLEIIANEIVLRGEVIVERAARDARGLRDRG